MPDEAGWAFAALNLPRERVERKTVLDIGSKMGTGLGPLVRRLGPSSYRTVDIRSGPGVDVICDIAQLQDRLGPEAADLILCTEVIEHVRDWKAAVYNLKRICKRGGTIILTTRSPGYRLHGLPNDYWRFTRTDMESIFSDFERVLVEDDYIAPGVFVSADKPITPVAQSDLSGISILSVRNGRRSRDTSELTEVSMKFFAAMVWSKLLEVASYVLSRLQR